MTDSNEQLKKAVLKLASQTKELATDVEQLKKVRSIARDGKDGRPGADGQRGQPGEKGERGPQGDRGPQGVPGRDGRDGQQGLPGHSVDKIAIEGENILHAWLGGVKSKVGKIQTQQGERGPMGPPGPMGPAGPAGKDGKDGASVTDLKVEGQDLYVWIDDRKKRAGRIEFPPLGPLGANSRSGGGGGIQQRIKPQSDTIVLIKNAEQLANLESDKVYVIDGMIDMGEQQIVVPAGGLQIEGYGFNVSRLSSSAENFTAFVSAPGGSGNLFIRDLDLSISGTNSKNFDLVDVDGTHEVSFQDVNFNGCTELGEIDGYLVLFMENPNFLGTQQGFTLSGTFGAGINLNTGFLRGVGTNFYLFREGTSFLVDGRCVININADFPAGATSGIADFNPANFARDSSFQLFGSFITRNDSYNFDNIAYLPNTSQNEETSLFRLNVGFANTKQLASWVLTTEVATPAVAGVPIKLNGTTTYENEVHFDHVTDNAIRRSNELPVTVFVTGSMTYQGTNGDVITIELRRWDNSAGAYVVEASVTTTVQSLPGLGAQATSQMAKIVDLDQLDRLELWVTNSNSNNVTLLEGSNLIANAV